MVRAHLDWAREKLGGLDGLAPLLDPESATFLTDLVLSTAWVPFRVLIRVDTAIARQMGGPPQMTYLELGRHSARTNLEGVYKSFTTAEPHHFFEKSLLLHERFQSFGRSSYEKIGERSGRIRMAEYPVYSPVYCATARGYFGEALAVMHAPGPISVRETACVCSGKAECVFDLSW